MARMIARAYFVLVAVLAAWVWYVEFSMRTNPEEHLLPGMVLSIATYPTSSAALYAAQSVPTAILNAWYFGPALLTLCASIQIAALFGVSRLETRFFDKIGAKRLGDGSEV